MEEILRSLDKLVSFHRQLLQTVESEHEALVNADLQQIEALTEIKKERIREISLEESNRIRLTTTTAVSESQPDLGSLEFSKAELRSLVHQIKDINLRNALLLEKSILHIQEMKKNILTESFPNSNTYTQNGQSQTKAPSSRLISREA